MFLLDTNVCVTLLDRSNENVWRRVHAIAPERIFVSIISTYELWYGAFKSARWQQNVARIDELQFQALSLDRGDARMAGEIRAGVERRGTPIGPYDLLIAGQAMARALTLVTNNTREFGRVDGLALADWS